MSVLIKGMATPNELIEWIEEGFDRARELGVTPNVILLNYKFKPIVAEIASGVRSMFTDVLPSHIMGMEIRYEFLPDDVNFVLQREIIPKGAKGDTK